MTKDILDKAKELERDIESLRILKRRKAGTDCAYPVHSLTITDSQSDSRKSCVTG